MKAILLAALLLVAIACGQTPGNPSASVAPPSGSTSGTPSQPLLFAVLQARGTANAWTYNTVVIAGLDGRERASATFAPMPVPATGCMGAVLPPSAHIAAGKVFYADARGVVRSLSIDGSVATAATFPMTSKQQMLSFAVSPDGTRLLGTVFTVPTNAFPCDGSPSGATYDYDAYVAAIGQPSRLVYHQSWTNSRDVLALTGWDDLGPIGTYPAVWASQGGGPASTVGVLVRVDAATVKPLARFSDPTSCLTWGSIGSGAFVCTGDSTITGGGTPQQQVSSPVSVRRSDGTELWHFTVTGVNAPSSPVLAPDAQHVMMCCADDSSGGHAELVISQDGSRVTLARGLFGDAWLDSRTIAGDFNTDPLKQPPFPLAYVRMNAPSILFPIALSGAVLGAVRA